MSDWNQPADLDAFVAPFTAMADVVRSEFALAVEHLTTAVRVANEHRLAHNVALNELAAGNGRPVMMNTRMVDVTHGAIHVQPIDVQSLALEAAVRALADNGIGITPMMLTSFDLVHGPSTQIR